LRKRISGIAVSMLMLIAAISMASMAGLAKPDLLNKSMTGRSIDGPIDGAEWTIMVYLDGDNNLQQDALKDLAEMEVVGSVGGVNVIVMMDTYDAIEGTHWYFIEAGSDHVNVEEGINACECEAIAGVCPGELNMGDPATLTYFLETAVAYAPADHYMLDLWDHGGGWWGVCYDDNSFLPSGSKDRLTMNEVATAVEAADVHLDIIGYDACFMGMVEIAYENRNIADYMVASITTVPGFGWDYTGLLNSIQALDEKTAEAVSIATVDAYITSYEICAGNGIAGYPYVSASAFDLSKVTDLVINGIDPLAAALLDLADDYFLRGAIESSESQTPQLQFAGEQFPFVDIGWYVTLMADKIPDLAALCDETFALLDEVVIHVRSVTSVSGGVLDTYGISIYFTCSWDKLYENYLTSDLDLVDDTLWDEFLFEFSMVYVE